MLEPCDVCGEATERGTCDECRQADRSQHKTARAKAILNVGGVNSTPPSGIPPYDPVVDGPLLTPEQVKRAGTGWIDRAYRSQRRD
jgi:hypothetical protein